MKAGSSILKQEVKRLERVPKHETFHVGALLAVVGGFLDAYTYLFRGGVFANAQTGNIVLLAIRLADGELKRAGYYIIPILAFTLGVFVTEWIKRKAGEKGFLIWEHLVILLEVLLLLVIGFLPAGIPDAVVNVTISFICSMQVCSFRRIHDISYASTMCTGNLRSAAENLFSYLKDKDVRSGKAAAKYCGVILFFIVGAALGTLTGTLFGLKSIWICCAVLLAVFGILSSGRKPQE